MEDTDKLRNIAIKVDKILKDELKKAGIKYTLAEARIYDIRAVGVQGDDRTYQYPAEIELRNDGEVIWDTKFTRNLSNRITNEVKEVNKVLYVFATKKSN